MSLKNIKSAAELLLHSAPQKLAEWFPSGKLHGYEFKVGNLRGDPGNSLSVNILTGIWEDFSTGEKGPDLIRLYALKHNMPDNEVAELFLPENKKSNDLTYLSGNECKKIPFHKRLNMYPTETYCYRDESGKVVGYVGRFDLGDTAKRKKEFAPLTQWINTARRGIWIWKKWPVKSPIYHADRIAANPDCIIIIVEGERKCDRAQLLLPPGYLAVAWQGGAKGVKETDWSLLQGRACWMWPDNDEAGRGAARSIKSIIPHLKIVKIPANLPEKWDLGDAPDDYNILANLIEDVEAAPLQVLKPGAPPTLAQALDRLNEQYAIILRGSQVLVMRHWMGEDGNTKLIFLSKNDFLLIQENNIVYIEDDKGDTKQLKIGKAWLEWKERQEFEEIYFEPNGKHYQKRYNLWRGFVFTPDATKGKFDLFLAHIKDNICQRNEEYYAWVMAWIADLFQRPARKLGTALVLRGEMGIGKGVFASSIGALLGIHYMAVTQASQLTGKFNAHLADKILMFVDEGWWSDERQGEGILRNLITEHQITIEMKGKDAIMLPNYTRFIVAANEMWVVPLGMGDERRFAIMDVGAEQQRNTVYFDAIKDQLKNGGYEALLHYFLNYEYSESLPQNVIKTPGMLENKIYSMNQEVKWWFECLRRESIGDIELKLTQVNDISCDDFYKHYQIWCDHMKLRPCTANILPKILRKAVINFNRKRITDYADRKYYYMMQTLNDMRRYFEDFIGHEIDWEAE
jgi:hypothetical protein